MPTLAEIRGAIKTRLQGVAAVGKVNDYERFAARDKEFQDLYKDAASGQIRGWNLHRQAKIETSGAVGRNVIVNRWTLRGFMALNDAAASAITFDNLVEAVCDAFRADETLGGVVASTVTENAAGIQVEESVPVMFAGVLCHSARLTLNTMHYL